MSRALELLHRTFRYDTLSIAVQTTASNTRCSNNHHVQRAAFYYPFVDRLRDGYTSMAYSTYIMLSNNTLAIAGTQIYGYTIDVSTFSPDCEAYQSAGASSTIIQKASSILTSVKVSAKLSSSSKNAWSIDVCVYIVRCVCMIPSDKNIRYKNLTNQPTFSNGPLCDNYIRLYNTTVTQGRYAPQNVRGTINVVAPFFPKTTTFSGVYGLKMDNAFIETNYVPCKGLQGYTASGPGD